MKPAVISADGNAASVRQELLGWEFSIPCCESQKCQGLELHERKETFSCKNLITLINFSNSLVKYFPRIKVLLNFFFLFDHCFILMLKVVLQEFL